METFNHIAGSLSALDREVVAAVPPGGNWRNLPDDFPSNRVTQIRQSAAAGQGSRSTYYGRLRWDRPAYTISTYFNRPGNGCFIHPEAPRLITVREAARLQSFPDHYRFMGGGRSPFLQVGNAVPPLLAEHLGRVLDPGSFIDMFAGAGGFSLGLEAAGHEPIAAVDHDKHALSTLRENGLPPERVHSDDLSTETGLRSFLQKVEAQVGKDLDLLVGGPPCQGFSTAGKNLRNDPRNRLVSSFLAAIKRLKPRRVLMENVPALLFKRRRPVLEALVRELEALGYSVETVVLHAEGYGVPQLRRRLFLQAVRAKAPSWPDPVRAISRPSQLTLQPMSALTAVPMRATSVREAISDLPNDTSSRPDAPILATSSPQSPFQKWARGLLTVEDLENEMGRLGADGPCDNTRAA